MSTSKILQVPQPKKRCSDSSHLGYKCQEELCFSPSTNLKYFLMVQRFTPWFNNIKRKVLRLGKQIRHIMSTNYERRQSGLSLQGQLKHSFTMDLKSILSQSRALLKWFRENNFVWREREKCTELKEHKIDNHLSNVSFLDTKKNDSTEYESI